MRRVGVGGDDDVDADADVGCGADEQVGVSEADDAMASHLRPDGRESYPSRAVYADGGHSPGDYDCRCADTDDDEEAVDVVKTTANY